MLNSYSPSLTYPTCGTTQIQIRKYYSKRERHQDTTQTKNVGCNGLVSAGCRTPTFVNSCVLYLVLPRISIICLIDTSLTYRHI